MNSRAQHLHSPRDTVAAKMQYILQAMLMTILAENAFANSTEVCQLTLKQNIKYMVLRLLVSEHLNYDPLVYSSNIEDCSPMIDPPASLIEVDLLLKYIIFCVAFVTLGCWRHTPWRRIEGTLKISKIWIFEYFHSSPERSTLPQRNSAEIISEWNEHFHRKSRTQDFIQHSSLWEQWNTHNHALLKT